MKKIILLSLVLILLTIAAVAQRGSGSVSHRSIKEKLAKRKAIKKDRISSHRINMNLRRQHRYKSTRRLNFTSNTESDNK